MLMVMRWLAEDVGDFSLSEGLNQLIEEERTWRPVILPSPNDTPR